MTERSIISRRRVLGATLGGVAISVVETQRASGAPVELAVPGATPAEHWDFETKGTDRWTVIATGVSACGRRPIR